jgi:hypothetical protein
MLTKQQKFIDNFDSMIKQQKNTDFALNLIKTWITEENIDFALKFKLSQYYKTLIIQFFTTYGEIQAISEPYTDLIKLTIQY